MRSFAFLLNLCILACGLLILVPTGSALVLEGTVDTRNYGAFLGKFCLGSKGVGTVEFEPQPFNGVRLNVFVDEVWDSNLREMNVPCKAYEAAALQHADLQMNAKDKFQINLNEQQRPHFWFFTVSLCPLKPGTHLELKIKYKLHLRSLDGRWDHEFSYDQRGIFETTTAYLLGLVCLFGWHLKILTLWWAAEKWFPSIIKSLTGTMVLQLGVTACKFTHLALFAGNGVGFPFLDLCATVGNAVATTLIMGLFIGIAKGRSFNDAEITKRFRVLIIGIVFLLTVSYASLFLWEWLIRDPSSTLYIYESYPGYFILCIRVTAMGVFLYFLKISYLEEFDTLRKSWYHWFGLIVVSWFLALPVIVFVSSIVSPWVREKTVYACEHIVQFVAYTALVYFTHPDNAVGQFVTVIRPFDEL